MPVPNSPTYNDIYHEPNPPGSSPVGLTFGNFVFPSYFQGPSGSVTYNYSGWGQGYVTTYDCIYCVRTENASGPAKFSTFQDQYYFYDQSNYQSQWTIDNQLPNQPWYNLNWNLTYYDSSLTYQYYLTAGGLSNPGVPPSTSDVSQPVTPLIYGVFWILQVDATDPMYPNDARVDLTIAGTSLLASVAITPGTNFYDSSVYGNSYMANLGAYTGTDAVITFHL